MLVLLASAALLLESFRRLMGEELGCRPQSVVMIDLSTWDMETNAELCQFYRTLQARLAALPGVEAVGTVSSAPLTGKWTFDEKAQVVGRPLPESERPSLAAGFVAFDYFQAMGIPLVEGRFFRDEELMDHGYGQIVMVNQSAADFLFPGKSAVGGRFSVGSNRDRVLEVVGVVKDTRDVRLEDRPRPKFYWQYPFGGAQVVVRSSMPASALIPMLRESVASADPRIIRHDYRTMTDILAGTVAEKRFMMTLLVTYAGMALVAAAIGIFGVVACQVAQRTNEFGIRLALGCSKAGILRLVLGQFGRLVFLGLSIGLVFFLATGRLLSSQVYGLSPWDPFLLGIVCVILFLVAFLACYLPAWSATTINPTEALRHE